MNNSRSGHEGENIAAVYLENRGYKIVCRNYRISRFGEIDIIAEKGEYICFVEVKWRRGGAFGTPAEAVTRKKAATIRLLAQLYLSGTQRSDANVRFDVIELYGCVGNMKTNHIINAF